MCSSKHSCSHMRSSIVTLTPFELNYNSGIILYMLIFVLTESWSPKIYFNHRCFSGPYLSKGRIADLPKSVGPGPMHLVLKEVLGLLINVAYKSCRALKEIQLDGPHNPHMKQCVLKAK